MRRLEEQLRKEHRATQQTSRRAKDKAASSNNDKRQNKSRPPQHQLPLDSESEDEQPRNAMSTVDGGDDSFAQAAAEYAQQNPQEANLAAQKSSPFETSGKQYVSRRKRQQSDEQKMGSIENSGHASARNSNGSRPKQQPTNTGKMNALLADLSETEAVGRRQKKSIGSDDKPNSTAARARNITMDAHDDVPVGKPAPGLKGTSENKALGDRSNSSSDFMAQAARLGTAKGVFDEIFAGESEESDNQLEEAAPEKTMKKQKTNKSSPSPAPQRRQQSKRLAAAAATAAAAAVATAELESSSEEEDEMDEIEQIGDFDAGVADFNDPVQTLDDDDFNHDDNESDDEDADSSHDDDQQQEIAAETSEQRFSSIMQDVLDEDVSQDSDMDENEMVRLICKIS
eukprot:COSAG02_NODE_417_length_22746_cov_9.074172_8_plen_399_part_00